MTSPTGPGGDGTLEHLAEDIGVEPEELAEETGLEPEDGDEDPVDGPSITTAFRGGE